MTFYKGQRVRITDNTCGHGFDIGDTVTLDSAEEIVRGDWDLWADDWIFDQDDCVPLDDNELEAK